MIKKITIIKYILFFILIFNVNNNLNALYKLSGEDVKKYNWIINSISNWYSTYNLCESNKNKTNSNNSECFLYWELYYYFICNKNDKCEIIYYNNDNPYANDLFYNDLITLNEIVNDFKELNEEKFQSEKNKLYNNLDELEKINKKNIYTLNIINYLRYEIDNIEECRIKCDCYNSKNNAINWQCWTVNWLSVSTKPYYNLCSKWTAWVVYWNWTWSWTCYWNNWWSNSSCNAYKK